MGRCGFPRLALSNGCRHNPVIMASPRRIKSATRMVTRKPNRQSVLVTGASGGIGRAICRAFAAAGWYVGVHYHRQKAEAAKTLRAVRVTGGTGGLYQADVREGESVRQMVEMFSDQASPPAAFICNAGIAASSLVLRQQEDAWMSVIHTNLTGTFHCLQAMASPLLIQGGGSIVVIGSHAGYHGSAGQAAYAASKAGLIGLVKTAAQEWGPQNVRVNLVLPGWHRTGLSEGTMPDDPNWPDHALRRPPAIEEVARTIVHMAQLHDLSGQVWNCDSRNV
ncbi:3-oxoacyl-(Acyl-carrier-protein) reductase [Nitrospira lenta]|uniref:3-oxoacyl-(Acyl-carrier-protein) reductase n=2 Tax=Nitrospira lenta TaxID=1436998 RepID=A0A330LAH4_9BACT|nr:3-oxoacyl-(Acyl-carrier-protein) reductase [Nitrospira lenta]